MPATPKLNVLKGKGDVLFGGTSGIELAVAQGVLEKGGGVLVVSSNLDKVQHAVKVLSDPRQTYNGCPERVSGAVLDLMQGPTLESSLKKLFAQQLPIAWDSRFDHIVHTAGRFPAKLPLIIDEGLTYESLHMVGDARLVSVLLIAKVAPKYWLLYVLVFTTTVRRVDASVLCFD